MTSEQQNQPYAQICVNTEDDSDTTATNAKFDNQAVYASWQFSPFLFSIKGPLEIKNIRILKEFAIMNNYLCYANTTIGR